MLDLGARRVRVEVINNIIDNFVHFPRRVKIPKEFFHRIIDLIRNIIHGGEAGDE